jgi:hypothetical protein
MTKIERLVIFHVIKEGDWLFRCSISNGKNIMILASNLIIPDSFMIRYFLDTEAAEEWVEGVKIGKYLDQ